MIHFSHFEARESILHTSSFHILKTILYIAICIRVNQKITIRDLSLNKKHEPDNCSKVILFSK